MRGSEVNDDLPVRGADRGRPRAFQRGASTGAGLVTPVGAERDADPGDEPRGRHPAVASDYLEVLEGPKRPSADFFQTRISTAASPSA